MQAFSYYMSPVGRILLTCDDAGMTGLFIGSQKYAEQTVPDNRIQNDSEPLLLRCKAWLDGYFAGENPSPGEIPLHPSGNMFRQTVWQCLLEIPYGTTVTYGEIAQKTAQLLGKERMSAQAVGGAVGHNPVSILIPCHRVIAASGALTGYAAGVAVKRSLLALESETIHNMQCIIYDA